MSIHDYVIANQNGANTRADLNNALAAIVSNNSSATEPSITYAFMWWADTANDLLKQRNAADSAWINILTLSTGQPTTLSSIDDNGDATAMTIDSSENIGIGTGSPDSALHVYKQTNDRSARFQRLSTQYVDMYQTSGINSFRSIGKDFEISTEDSNDLILATNSIERARVLSTGGITFNGDTVAANALDDYEEGTWTPTVSGGTMTITVNSATYTKVGDMVTVWCHVGGGNNGDGTTLAFTGLPFTTASSGSNYYTVGSPLNFNNGNAALTNPHTRVGYSSSTIYFYNNGSGGLNQSQVDYGHLIFTITYKAA